MNIDWAETAKTATLATLMIYNAWTARKEWRAQKRGLSANPTRCTEHAVALATLKADVGNIKEDIKEIKGKLR
jgi:hypothetical protein